MVSAPKKLTIWDQTLHLVENKLIMNYPTNTDHYMKLTSSHLVKVSEN